MGTKLTVEVTQGKANISLSETQGNAFVFQFLGKLLKFLSGEVLLCDRYILKPFEM